MTEETTLAVQTSPEPTQQGRPEMTIPSERLGNNFFGIETKEEEKIETKKEEVKKDEKVAEVKQEEKKEESKVWHKDFGWETEEAAKAEIAELKKLKDQKPEYKFENDESKRLAEAISKGDRKTVLSILETQERLESLVSAEVNDETAESIIKLNMSLKYKDLSQKEIDYKFNKEYGFPKEPTPKDDDLDGEFEARKAEWQEKVNDIKMTRAIEAKLAKPELEKLKTQIVLPDISQSSEQKQPTQEELDAVKKYDDNYVQSVEDSVKNFGGVTVAVKNEVVDFAVEYGATDEDKKSLSSLMKEFQKGGYDANGLFADLWVNEDKTLKTNEMIEDYYLIKNKKAMFSKIANDSANKAIEAYIKGKKKINVNETSNSGTAEITNEGKTELDLVRDAIFG